MKVLLYIKPEREADEKYGSELKNLLNKHGIRYFCVENDKDADIADVLGFDAIISLGGDGTLLRRTELANRYGIPILGINCGKLGFLTEFETAEAEKAVVLLKDGNLVKEERLTLNINFNGKNYLALNDAVISRIYEEDKRMVVSVNVSVGGNPLYTATGDGVIVATPTGSTAYSLSAGGAVLQPHINAFCITPIASHSFGSRSLVCSADNECVLLHEGGASAGLYVDGKLVGALKTGDKAVVTRAEKNTPFLRKIDYDFFARLNKKMQDI